MLTSIIIILFIACIFLTIRFSIFLPAVKGLPVLMYHKVSPGLSDQLTISVQNIEKQFSYLSEKGYSCMTLNRIIDTKPVALRKRAFMLTFDDAYVNILEYVYPLLQKYNFHATLMLPVGFLGKTNGWDNGDEPIMNYGQLRSMDSRYVSFGLHTYGHTSLKTASTAEIEADIEKCRHELNRNGIPYLPVVAYPYGAYPREAVLKAAFIKTLEKSGIILGLRIGNRVNKWPVKNRFEVKRIDIRGTDSLWAFKTKLKKGRVKMF